MEFNYDFEKDWGLSDRLQEIGANAICKAISEENKELYDRAVADELLMPAVIMVNPIHKGICKELRNTLNIKFIFDYNVKENEALQITDKECLRNILGGIQE